VALQDRLWISSAGPDECFLIANEKIILKLQGYSIFA